MSFTDDRDTSTGNGSTGQSSVAMGKNNGNWQAPKGRKRRDASFFLKFNNRTKRSSDDDDDHRGDNCHEHDFCIKNGICLMRARENILRVAEIYGIPAKKLCLPKDPPIHGKQCWISGWSSGERTPIEVNMFNDGDNNGNQWCIEHRKGVHFLKNFFLTLF